MSCSLFQFCHGNGSKLLNCKQRIIIKHFFTFSIKILLTSNNVNTEQLTVYTKVYIHHHLFFLKETK